MYEKNKYFLITLILMIFIFTFTLFPNSTWAEDEIPSLHELFEDHFYIGAALSNHAYVKQTLDTHRDLIETHFNSATAENVMKPEEVQPTRGDFDFDRADELIEVARENDMKVRGHTLVWHNQTPDWFFEDSSGQQRSKEEVLEIMEEHIETVMTHFEDDVYAWDVVNEAIDNGDYRQTPWLEIVGDEYIAHAFEYAHQVDPEAKLFYNDYNTVQRRDKIYDMVKGLIEDGVPIHGIGMQGHWDIGGPSINEIEYTIEKFAELDELTDYDFEIQITELDISIYEWHEQDLNYQSPPADRMAQQADRYEDLFELFIDHSDKITSVSFWGLADDKTWLDNFPVQGRDNWPFLFDENHEPKEAFWRVVDLVK